MQGHDQVVYFDQGTPKIKARTFCESQGKEEKDLDDKKRRREGSVVKKFVPTEVRSKLNYFVTFTEWRLLYQTLLRVAGHLPCTGLHLHVHNFPAWPVRMPFPNGSCQEL